VITISNSEYTQIKVCVDSQIASAFKSSCLESDVSMASVLSQYMAKYSGISYKTNSSSSLSTKRQRRAALDKVVQQLEHILTYEESYRDRIPENLQSSIVFEAADQWVSVLEEAIESFRSLL